jgi:hypothetical protein
LLILKLADGLAYAMASGDVGQPREHQGDYFSVGRASTKLNDRCSLLVSCVVGLRPHWKYVKTTQATHSECDRHSMLTSDCVQLSKQKACSSRCASHVSGDAIADPARDQDVAIVAYRHYSEYRVI